MKWNAVADVPPPKDRVIIVTGGFCWQHKDTHFPARPERSGRGRNGPWKEEAREEYTSRSWRIAGNITYAIWFEQGEASCWIDAARDMLLPPFQFWCEVENPFQNHELVSAVPPRGLSERFDGDARLAENTAAVAKQEEWIANLERMMDDPRETENGRKSLSNQIERARESLEKIKAVRDRSYDPYPLPK